MLWYKGLHFDADNGAGAGGSGEGDAGGGQVPTPAVPSNNDTDDDLKDMEAMRKEIRRLRDEAAKNRVKGKAKGDENDKLKKAIATALGIAEDDATPEQLEKQLNETKLQLRRERIETKYARIASKLEADADLTLAVLERKKLLNDLDPEDEDFESDLTAIIKAELKTNPKLKAGVQANKTGTEHKDGADPNQFDMGAWIRKEGGIR